MTNDTNTNDSPMILTIAVLGGTGKEGAGLAMRWALNGYRVIIGSRSEERAISRVAEINEQLGGDYLVGMQNSDAAREANMVVLSVPYSAHKATLEGVKEHLYGKILIDVTVPTVFPEPAFIPDGKSAALEAQALLGDSVRVVSAFQNVSATKIKKPDMDVGCDVLVTGDDMDAKHEVLELIKASGMRGFDAGPLANSVAAEALTPVLIYINRTYKVKGAGIRITNIE